MSDEWPAFTRSMTMCASPVLPVPAPHAPPPAPVTKAAPQLPGALLPGCYGVSHGSGMAGELIRHATESWAGHAFIYIGDGMIIEGVPPATRVSPAAAHPDAVWNLREKLTDEQRRLIVGRAHALLGTPYDYPAYIGFALMCLKLRDGKQLDPFFQRDHWRVCSADVADAYSFAGIDLTAGLLYPNLVSPGDLYDRLVKL